MAVSGSISIKQNSQSIANNTSSITVTGKATMSGPSYDNYTRTGTLTIDGKDYKFSTTFPRNSTKTLFSKTVTIKHNDKGEKTVSASFSIKTGMTGTLPNGVISESTSRTLTKIPRASKVSMSNTNFVIGNNITINTNRVSNSFTHKIVIKFNGKTIRTQTNVGSSYSWNTTELYQYIPNANSATGTVTCTTYSDGENIGSSSVSFTANVRNSNPIFSNFEVEDTNETTLALTGDETKYIKKYSSAKVTIPAVDKMEAQNYATSKAYNMIIGDKSYTASYSDTEDISYTFNNIDANIVNVYAVDSRNNQTEASKSLNMMEYTEVLLQSIDVHRENGVGTNVVVTANGRYDNINFGLITNSIKSIQFRKKRSDLSTWNEWQSIMYLFDIDTETGTFETNPTLLSPDLDGFELGVEYDVQIKVTDELSEDVEEVQINSGKVLMSAVKDQGICFGGIYDTDFAGALQLATVDGVGKILAFKKEDESSNENNGYLVDENGNEYLTKTYKTDVYQDGENGHIKFENGFQICWKSMTVNAGGTRWTDNLFYSDHNMGSWTSSFTQLRSVSAVAKSTTFWCTAAEASNTSAGKIRCFRPNNNTAEIRLYICGYGKWK